MKNLKALVLFSILAAIAGCGGAGSLSKSDPTLPPVQAATGYSTASLTGTYSLSAVALNPGAPNILLTGSIVFDGNGDITQGNLTVYGTNGYSGGVPQPCVVGVTGSYLIAPDASGTALIALSNASACGVGGGSFILQAAQSGETVMFGSFASDGLNAYGTAVKQ